MRASAHSIRQAGAAISLLLLLCITTSCGTHRQVEASSVPTLSAEALYASLPRTEGDVPDLAWTSATHTAQQQADRQNDAIFADSLLAEAYRHLNTPYAYGALGPAAFDCSGFVRHVFGRFGYDLPHSSAAMAHVGYPVACSAGHYKQLQKGDIVLFGSRRSTDALGHVGIVIAADDDGRDGTFIHAAVHGGVIVSRFSEPYYTARFHGARRII